LPLNGCQDSNVDRSGVDVIIDGDGGFPEFLVGTWTTDSDVWEFVFEEDGTISSAVVSLGAVRLKPGRVTTVPMHQGGEGIFEPGRWVVQYNPDERELIVKISIKNFYIELGEDTLDGSGEDIFVGRISEDGESWPAEWTSYPKYTAHTDENPSFNFFDETDSGITKLLIFEKMKEE